MRAKFSIDADIKKTESGVWEVMRFEQIATSEKIARRRVIQRAKEAGFYQVGMQKTIAKAHAL